MRQVKRRNRAQTTERILHAMGEIMAERGTQKAGINAVAERAGVNKVLIYRYFGGWEGLLEAYVQRGFFLSLFNEQFLKAVPNMLPAEHRDKIWAEYVIRFMHEFRIRKSSQELIRWEMVNGETELAQRLAAFREQSYQNLLNKVAPFPEYDPIAITTILVMAVTHLILTSSQRKVIAGIDLDTPEGWERIENAIKRIFNGLNLALEQEQQKTSEA